MSKIEIQITNRKTMKLLQDLEDLQLLRIVKKRKQKAIKLSELHPGSLSSEVAEEMQKYITESRSQY